VSSSGKTKSAKPEDSRRLIGKLVAGRYAVQAVIGAGAKGTVYLAWDRSLEREVGLKVPSVTSEETVKRFLREGRAGASIGHPNVCAIYDFGPLEDGTPFLVMERLKGETLSERLHRMRRLPVAEAVDITLQILGGLEAAHGQGIVHRDLKPGNVSLGVGVDDENIVKILDFGASTLVHGARWRDEEFESLTKVGTAIGTPIYMSPEQVRGLRDLDSRVDVYAAGIMLYEMIVGVPPFNATSRIELFRVILKGAFTPASRIEPLVPPALDQVLARALAGDRAARFSSAAAFQGALDAVRSSSADRALTRPSWSPDESVRLVALQERLERVSSYYVESASGLLAAKPASTADIPIDVEEDPTLRDFIETTDARTIVKPKK
jgi:serine/threonine-protein kinase